MTKLKRIGTFLCAAALMFTISGCSFAKSIKINLKKGDKYAMTITTDYTNTVRAYQETANTTEKLNIKYDMDVTDVDKDKTSTIKMKYDTIKLNKESGESTLDYDSTSDDKYSDASEVYGSFIGKSFTVKISDKGEVLKVEGADEIVDSVLDKVDVDEDDKPAAKKALNKYFGAKAVKAIFVQGMGYYPEKRMHIGDTWDSNYKSSSTISMAVKNTYKLLNDDNNKYAINIDSTLKPSSNNSSVDIDGTSAKMTFSGNLKGNVNVNKDNGFLSDGTLKESIKGNMTMKISESSSKELNMPITIQETIKYNITKR